MGIKNDVLANVEEGRGPRNHKPLDPEHMASVTSTQAQEKSQKPLLATMPSPCHQFPAPQLLLPFPSRWHPTRDLPQ
jgi:hypothetical protein